MTTITWLANPVSNENLFEWLCERCTPEQTGIIMDHIGLLGSNMQIGYNTSKVFVIDNDTNEILEISKQKL